MPKPVKVYTATAPRYQVNADGCTVESTHTLGEAKDCAERRKALFPYEAVSVWDTRPGEPLTSTDRARGVTEEGDTEEC